MKNGFFSSRKPSSFFLLLASLLCLQLEGCASFLQLGESGEDPAEFDRGYATEETGSGDAEAAAPSASDRALASAGEDGNTENKLSYAQRRIKSAIEMRDVVLGMTRQEVMESWGTPAQREVAGRTGGGHERWTYGSRFSLNGSRTVIFENGKVAGWSH